MMTEITTLDFETHGIGPRPDRYPPIPVGLAIRHPDGTSEYLAWGHPSGNNTTFEEGRRAWFNAIRGPVLFHNAAFDLEVAQKHFGAPWPKEYHDTLFLAYLHDAHARTYSLKPTAHALLGMAPEEQDAVRDWILANVDGANKRNFGAYIALAPPSLVGPYAIGDVERTFLLFQHLHGPVEALCGPAYARERRLLPFLLDSERRGTRVDTGRLTRWQEELTISIDTADHLLRARLNAPGLTLSNDAELAAALDAAGVMNGWEYTDGTSDDMAIATTEAAIATMPFGGEAGPTAPGKAKRRSVSRPALSRHCRDATLLRWLEYRGIAATMLGTFVSPWLKMSAADGRLHTKWHQVRGDFKNGTRTGRIASSDPNLANIPNAKDVEPPPGCTPLPVLRSALLPEEGHVWLSADYSQQELRWTAHFAEGDLMGAYRRDPRLDLHEFAKDLVKGKSGIAITRKQAKTIAFASIYGAGLAKLAQQLGCSTDEAHTIREAYFNALPGIRTLSQAVQAKGKLIGFVMSAGGRAIRPEQPAIVDGVMRTYEYKLLNHLIQGSAADQTKQAIVDFCVNGAPGRFLNSVYDEINVSVPADPDTLRDVGNRLARCMRDALPCDVPILTDFEVGPSWGELSAVGAGEPATTVLERVLR